MAYRFFKDVLDLAATSRIFFLTRINLLSPFLLTRWNLRFLFWVKLVLWADWSLSYHTVLVNVLSLKSGLLSEFKHIFSLTISTIMLMMANMLVLYLNFMVMIGHCWILMRVIMVEDVFIKVFSTSSSRWRVVSDRSCVKHKVIYLWASLTRLVRRCRTLNVWNYWLWNVMDCLGSRTVVETI